LDSFLVDYNSPAFSIIMGALILGALFLVTYWWGKKMQVKEKNQLMSFLEKFGDSNECVLDTGDIDYDPDMHKPLLLLAKAYESSGEYQKTVSIYLFLIRHTKRDELLEQLGKIYLRAGMLDRAEEIFLQILQKRPRDKNVLYQLGVVYQLMQRPDLALETLDPLEILGEDVEEMRAFWEFSMLQNNKQLSFEEKKTALLEAKERHASLYKHVLPELFAMSSKEAWKHVDNNRLGETLDMFWYLPKEQLDLDIISSNGKLTKIYYARGDIEMITPEQNKIDSGIVSIDILSAARHSGENRGELSFTYLCDNCKHTFPITFKRCHNCLAVNSEIVEEHITKHEKADYSLF